MQNFTHFNTDGEVFMVDVSVKKPIKRTASAIAKIVLSKDTIEKIQNNSLQKGNALSAAKIAGIMAVKKTDELIPLCHSLPIEHADLFFDFVQEGIEIKSLVVTTAKTGVEMEALIAVSVAALCIYDMCKAVDKNIKIENIYLLEKKKFESFKIVSVNISEKKGEVKIPVSEVFLVENKGIECDAHADGGNREVSLLSSEEINKLKQKGFDVNYGDFAENITTNGVELDKLPIGTLLYLGEAILQITQIGKECHSGCNIFQKIGKCIMPEKGVFAKIIKGGKINNESNCYYCI